MSDEEIPNIKIPLRNRIKGGQEIEAKDHTQAATEDAGGTVKIPLTKGKFCLIDAADYPLIAPFKWSLQVMGYAQRSTWHAIHPGKRSIILMHRAIMNPSPNMEVDHINGNKLDNRRANLRIATHAQNLRNMKLRKDNKCGLKGVGYVKRTNNWRAYIKADYKYIHLGTFPTKEEAAAAYQKASLELHGQFSTHNS